MQHASHASNSSKLKRGLCRLAGAAAVTLLLGACASQQQKPIAPVAKVDLPRFMGDWYVIASIPTYIEKEAFNAVESYTLLPDGTIDTVFTFNKGSSDGEAKRYNPHGFVVENTNNAVWGMQFVWPIKAEYIIAYLADDYSSTVVARNARDYVWIMARQPMLSAAKYQELTGLVQAMGYDMSKLRAVPQAKQAESSKPEVHSK